MNAVLNEPVFKPGAIKTFGAFGPKYEVRELLRRLDDGDWLMRVRVIDSGEEAEYRYSRMQADPEAR
jgi:hypothetical protein